MKRTWIILLSITLIAIFVVSIILIRGVDFKSKSEPEPGKVKDIEFILIKSAFGFDSTGIYKPNAALLLTDKNEIIENQKIFLSERIVAMSLNGCDYVIQFWENGDCMTNEVGIDEGITTFNYKPEIAQQRLSDYISKLEFKPTHYIYNLTVTADKKPVDVKHILEGAGCRIFFVDDTLSRYPEFGFSFTHDIIIPDEASVIESESVSKDNDLIIKHKIHQIVSRIGTVCKIIHKSDIIFSRGGKYENSKDSKTHVYAENYIFLSLEQGIDTLKVLKIIKNEGATSFGFHVPKDYNIQLVDTTSDIKLIKLKLKDYKIIRNISEYSDPQE